MGRKKSKALRFQPLKRSEFLQIRLTGPEKARWRALATIYAGGNLSLFIAHCVKTAPREILK